MHDTFTILVRLISKAQVMVCELIGVFGMLNHLIVVLDKAGMMLNMNTFHGIPLDWNVINLVCHWQVASVGHGM